jgi:hypothetical protein
VICLAESRRAAVVDVLQELTELRELVLRSIDRVNGMKLDDASVSEIRKRMEIVKEIETDIAKFKAALDAQRP